MRLIKITLYLLAILVLQTVVFARLNFFGAVPDLVLVSVIIFAVLQERSAAILFAAAAGFVQDILSFGVYINVVSKVLASTLVTVIKESYRVDEYSLAAGLVAILTPSLLVAEGVIFYFVSGRQIDIQHLLISVILATIYNLILVPVLLPVARKILHD
ncbi:MAG: rod shape-determining protein MreD [Candidatus Margulisiibacteriota bacterium]